MPNSELLLRVEVLKGFVVRVKNKFLRQKILSPIVQILHYLIEFFIVGKVIQPSTAKLFTEKELFTEKAMGCFS